MYSILPSPITAAYSWTTESFCKIRHTSQITENAQQFHCNRTPFSRCSWLTDSFVKRYDFSYLQVTGFNIAKHIKTWLLGIMKIEHLWDRTSVKPATRLTSASNSALIRLQCLRANPNLSSDNLHPHLRMRTGGWVAMTFPWLWHFAIENNLRTPIEIVSFPMTWWCSIVMSRVTYQRVNEGSLPLPWFFEARGRSGISGGDDTSLTGCHKQPTMLCSGEFPLCLWGDVQIFGHLRTYPLVSSNNGKSPKWMVKSLFVTVVGNCTINGHFP